MGVDHPLLVITDIVPGIANSFTFPESQVTTIPYALYSIGTYIVGVGIAEISILGRTE